MKRITFIIIIMLFSKVLISQVNPYYNMHEIQKIKLVIENQKISWNNGNIEEFMKGYWRSEKLIFSSKNHKTSYGWEQTLRRYKESYPTKESMGEFKFDISDIRLTSDTSATIDGKWELIRKNDHPKGSCYLELRKINGSWLITKDYTTNE